MDFKSLFLVLFILLLSTVTIIVVAFIQEGIGNDFLGHIDNVSKLILDNQTQEDVISNRMVQYNDSKINYDTIFLTVFVTIEITAIVFSIMSPKLPNLSFITFLFFGSALLLFIYGIIIDLTNYLYNTLLLGIFTDTVFVMPLYNYFIGNPYLLLGINIIMLLIINKLFGRNVIDQTQISGGAIE